jgi:alpha-galactosidase
VNKVFERLDIRACGINHMTWITHMFDREAGIEIYDEFRARLAASPPEFEPVCRRLHDIFGLYPTSGDAHIGEHLPWSHLAPSAPDFNALIARSNRRSELLDAVIDGSLPARELLNREGKLPLDRAPAIIAGVVAARNQFELAVNVPNRGCVDGLSPWAVVEVPGMVGADGVRGLTMGALPPGITALLNEQIAVQDRAVEAAIHGDPIAAQQALLLDPVSNQNVGTAEALLRELLSA